MLETYFVMGMYGMIVMGVILLCEAGDEKVDPGVSPVSISVVGGDPLGSVSFKRIRIRFMKRVRLARNEGKLTSNQLKLHITTYIFPRYHFFVK